MTRNWYWVEGKNVRYTVAGIMYLRCEKCCSNSSGDIPYNMEDVVNIPQAA